MRLEQISLLVSVLALVVAGAAFFKRADPASVSPGGDTQRNTTLADRQHSNEGAAISIAELEQRLTRLESRVTNAQQGQEQLASRNDAHATVVEPPVMGSMSFTEEDYERMQSDPEFARSRRAQLEEEINDFNLSESKRLDAIMNLAATASFSQDQEALDSSLLDSALEISQSTADPNVRIKAWEVLSFFTGLGEVGDALTEPLIQLVNESSNARLRHIAVQALHQQLINTYVMAGDDNGIAAVLESVSLNDTDESVRRQAELSLKSFKENKKMIDAGSPGVASFGAVISDLPDANNTDDAGVDE